MASFFKNFTRKEDPTIYQSKDGHLKRTLRVKDFLALGVGTIVSTSIFTLPGVVAAEHAGPAVALSFLLAAIVAGLVAFSYAEMAAAMPLLVLHILGLTFYLVNSLMGSWLGITCRILYCRCLCSFWFFSQFKRTCVSFRYCVT